MQLTADSFAGLADNEVDFVVVADGSGCKPIDPCGYFAAVLEIATGRVTEVRGATSHGTNNHAELAPFLLAFSVIEACGFGKPRILCISDSEVTVKGGTREFARAANAALWAGISYYERLHWRISWKWIPRNSHAVHEYTDTESKHLRQLMKDSNHSVA